MRAVIYDSFCGPVDVRTVDDPVPRPDSVILQVSACGLCRSDWHGWMGHDSDIALPHVPGHELVGTVAAVGSEVHRWKRDQRVTTPFCCGCGTCRECRQGHPQVCDHYTQPGFTHWGGFAEYVEIRHADVNLVLVPSSVSDEVAASLGCRFATAFRAVADQGRTGPGDFLVVHGCGGVGLSAVMIGSAMGATVIAVDVRADRLESARACGADYVINSLETPVVQAVSDLAAGGATVSVDAFGSRQTCRDSVLCLRPRGRHIQVGLLAGEETDPPIPMSAVIAKELEILGSHGMQAVAYDRMLNMIATGRLAPEKLISRKLSLTESAAMLPRMNEFPSEGVMVMTDLD